jgi:TolB-like protein
MRRVRRILLALIAALTAAACTTPQSSAARAEQERIAAEQAAAARAQATLAILPFTGGQGEDGETIAELFSFQKELIAVFSPVPRTSINHAIRNEQRFQMTSGMTDPDTIAALGKQLGASYVAAGNIATLGGQKLLIIAIIKIDELRQVAGDVQTYGSISEIQGKLPDMARTIASALKADASNLPLLALPPAQWPGGANNREADTRDADTLAQILAVHLVRSGKYAVYPRTKSLEQVQEEYGNQFGGDVADEYLPTVGMGNNPRLVLSVTARKLDKDTMFNAAVINLETGVQEDGASVDYQSLEDGARAMQELALKLTGQGERAARIKAPAEAARYTFAVRDSAAFARAIAAIDSDKTGGAYAITVTGPFASGPVVFAGDVVKTITLKGDGATCAIANNADQALFTVPAGVTLVLDNGVTLYGNGKSARLVDVQGGALRMNSGSTVRGAKSCGVVVREGGMFTMAGGEISGNTTSYAGGGVYVYWGETFTMEGGEISGNTASFVVGGVLVYSRGTFVKRGRSTIDAANSAKNGKVVYVGGSSPKRRDAAAGPGVTLDSAISGSIGDWE